MTLSTQPIGTSKPEVRQKRTQKAKIPNFELIQIFWRSPLEAFFSQDTVSAVTGRSIKTLECDRWRGIAIPFRKVGGKVLYRKSDIVNYLESHELVISTSQYKEG